VAQGDVALENAGVNDEDKVVLFDFGLARDAKNSDDQVLGGKAPYMHPYFLQQRGQDKWILQAPNAAQCDLWSLGTAVYGLVVGYAPWPKASLDCGQFRSCVEMGCLVKFAERQGLLDAMPTEEQVTAEELLEQANQFMGFTGGKKRTKINTE
jgi:serine/threonine protein kinase